MGVFDTAFGQLVLSTVTTSPCPPSQRVDLVRNQTEFADVGEDASIGASVWRRITVGNGDSWGAVSASAE